MNGADGAVFDAREDKLIIHRPYRFNPELTTPFQLDYVSEVWVFDFKTREWTNPQPEDAAAAGALHVRRASDL